MRRRVAEHPFMESAELLRDMARAIRQAPPHALVPFVPAGMAPHEARAKYERDARELERMARSDEAWLAGEA